MSGKKKISNKPTGSDWGGKRSNPGGRPPKVTITQQQLDRMHAKAEKWAKKHEGKTVDDFLLMCIYGEQEPGWKLTMRDRITCAKIWKEYTMAKVQEKNINTNQYPGPVIGLPPSRPDPAKLIQKNPEKIIPINGGKR